MPGVQGGQDDQGQDGCPQPDPAGAPALNPDRPGRAGQQADELGMQVPALGPQQVAQLGGQGQAAGGREPLGDLLNGEVLEGSAVDPLGAGAQGQTEHHVGQVYGLAPRRGAGLDEGHVDQQHAAVADQQVGRLDVAVGQPGVPQLADDPQAVVDDGVVDLGL